MKKTLCALLVSVLLTGLVSAAPAGAKKAKKGRKPVATALYLHGNYPVGDGAEVAGFLADGTIMTMDATEPTGPPKSMSYSLPVGNDQCTGNPLFPSWDGELAGTIKGDVTWIAHFVAAPSEVTARLWIDIPFSSCTSGAAEVDQFVPPVAETVVEVPPGSNEVKIVFKKVNKKVTSNMIVELHQTSPANQGRVVYDSADFATRLEFKCVPARGKACTS